MAETEFDLIVIGAGPGGYVAAIRAAQLGLRTACAESRETLGGTCLNVGCIPSKALLHASELFEEAAHGTLAKWGVMAKEIELDLDAMHAGRKEAVKGLTQGVEFLFKKNKVTWLKGHAKFTGRGSVDVGGTEYKAKNIVVATGSSVTPLPGVEIDQQRIVDSTGALELPEVPGHLVVVGGGVIGLELGSVWRRLGAEVTVIGIKTGPVQGKKGGSLDATTTFSDVSPDQFDALVIPDVLPFWRAVLDYRYWVDEPGNDVMWFWSENHALCFHVSQLLAGAFGPGQSADGPETLRRRDAGIFLRREHLRRVQQPAASGFAHGPLRGGVAAARAACRATDRRRRPVVARCVDRVSPGREPLETRHLARTRRRGAVVREPPRARRGQGSEPRAGPLQQYPRRHPRGDG